MSSSEVCSQPGAPSHVEIRKLLSLCVRFYYALGNSRASSALARRAFRFPMPSSDALAVLVERNGPERTLVALTMLSTLLTKAREDAAKYGSIKSGSKALASKVLQLEGGVVALECIGFRLQDDAYVFDASAESEDVAAALAVFEARADRPARPGRW